MPDYNLPPDIVRDIRELMSKVRKLEGTNQMIQRIATGTGTYKEVLRLPGDEVYITVATTGSGANMYVDPTTGQVLRSVSSIRYKEQVIDLPASLAPQLIQLRPRGFKMKDDPEGPWHVGFIAEEAEDLGLSYWVIYDEEGNPESFDYGLWSAAVQLMVQLLWKHINDNFANARDNFQDVRQAAIDEFAQTAQDIATLRADATAAHNTQQVQIDKNVADIAKLRQDATAAIVALQNRCTELERKVKVLESRTGGVA